MRIYKKNIVKKAYTINYNGDTESLYIMNDNRFFYVKDIENDVRDYNVLINDKKSFCMIKSLKTYSLQKNGNYTKDTNDNIIVKEIKKENKTNYMKYIL